MTEQSQQPSQPHQPKHPPRALRVALTAMKAAALGGLVGLLVVAGLGTRATTDVPVASASDTVLEQAMTSQQCSVQGFGPATIPGSAVIRTPAGKIRVVSFDHGWDVFQDRRPGTLVAVCLRDVP